MSAALRLRMGSLSVAERTSAAVAVGSFLLMLGLGALGVQFASQLALAQAADSLSDTLMALALLGAIHVAAQPADESHPHGHHGAEPIAALLTAVFAGVLAVEVMASAARAIARGDHPTLAWTLAAAYAVKIAFKLAVSVFAHARQKARPSPALRALEVDARNDCLVGLLGLAGYFAARFEWEGWDAYLAFPVGVYIGYSGVRLGLENIRLLMGAAASEGRRLAFEALVASVPGVERVGSLTAHHHGSRLVVTVAIVVDADLTLRRAHDIGLAVEQRLLREDDVAQCIVHIDEASTALRTPSAPPGTAGGV